MKSFKGVELYWKLQAISEDDLQRRKDVFHVS